MNADLIKTISRIRRAMPRNADVMTVCDELERRICNPPAAPEYVHGRGYVGDGKNAAVDLDIRSSAQNLGSSLIAASGGFDKKAYQREYMKQRRAKLKASPKTGA